MSFMGLENHLKFPDVREENSRYSYVCGHCNRTVSGFVVATYDDMSYSGIKWLLCTNCGCGSVVSRDNTIYPGEMFGPEIEGLPENIGKAYKEARLCMSVNAFTACELISRTILMYVAVEKGAKERDTFANYITFLSEKGYITPPMVKWVALIKEHGGKAAHIIEPPDRTRAECTLMFTAEMLRLVYEMEHIAEKFIPKTRGKQ